MYNYHLSVRVRNHNFAIMKHEYNNISRIDVPFYSSCYSNIMQRELFERNFKLIKVLSGHALLSCKDSTVTVNAGEFAFVTPGGFSKIKMFPAKNYPFRLVCLNFSDKFLQEYARHNPTNVDSPEKLDSCFQKVKSEVWLEALYASLSYYTMHNDMPDETIVTSKQTECLHILRTRHKDVFHAMFSKSSDSRTDLIKFINENYMYNAPLKRFAELSGRSLSTFRRECLSLTGMQPTKWILQKRLETAYRKLTCENARPSDIYWELGFETLAHFSRKFKEKYGVAPSRIKSITDKGNGTEE